MTLIIEDGSIVEDANTFISLEDVKSYADLRGIDYPADNELSQNIILAGDYLNSLCWKGGLVIASQSMSWPRSDVFAFGEILPNNEIPSNIKSAQIEATLAQSETNLLSDGSDNNQSVKKEKADMLETEYFDGGKQSVFQSQKVSRYTTPLLQSITLGRV